MLTATVTVSASVNPTLLEGNVINAIEVIGDFPSVIVSFIFASIVCDTIEWVSSMIWVIFKRVFSIHLACDCDRRGSFSLACRGADGQCPCLRNYAGRQCDRCQVGNYDFPYCRNCNCQSAGLLLSNEAPTGCYSDNPVSTVEKSLFCSTFSFYVLKEK